MSSPRESHPQALAGRVEQLALSLTIARRYDVTELGDVLHHYWNYSYEAPFYLDEIFAGMPADLPIERQAAYCFGHEWSEARLKQLQAAPEHKRRRRINKWRASIAKRKIDLRVLLAHLQTIGKPSRV